MLDFDFITDRIAVGGALETHADIVALKRLGITHILNTRIEFDDRTLLLSGDHDPAVLDLGIDDDHQPQPADFFFRGVRFALAALEEPGSKLLIHCASGIHRGPMVALALLRVLGYDRHEAVRLLRARRPQADFPEVYLDSVEAFLAEWKAG
ncbi:MAG: dual specificity protein phosphatase family protein [Terriglobia bacterium]